MKSAAEYLAEILERDDAKSIMETALRNLIENAEDRDITQEDIAIHLCSAMGKNYYQQ
jgi:intergrase/recombinase